MKSTKKSLLLSTLSLVLCFAMLLGTTYAWFTDEVTSGVNQIKAGNLDVELTHTSASVTTAASVKDQTNLFTDKTGNAMLWEPGAVSYENFTVSNVGSLAFKYNMSLNITDYNAVSGTAKDLREPLKVMVLTGENILPSVTRETVAALDWGNSQSLADFKKDGGTLYPTTAAGKTSSEAFQVIVYWQPGENDNQWNVNNTKTTTDGQPLFVEFGVNLVATQLQYEEDSFGPNYDGSTVIPTLPKNIDKQFKSAPINGTTYEGTESVEVVNKNDNSSTVASVPAAAVKSIVESLATGIVTEEGTDVNTVLVLSVKTNEVTAAKASYNIDLTAVMTYTNTSGEKEQKELDSAAVDTLLGENIVTATVNIGANLVNVSVKHSGEAMPELGSASADEVGFFYERSTGALTIKTKSFSPFEIEYDLLSGAACIERDNKYVPYDSLDAALNDMKDGETVILLADLTEQGIGWSPKAGNYTLDLNGHNIEGKKLYDPTYTLRVYGQQGTNVTITDTSDHPGSIIGYGDAPYLNPNDGHSMNGTLYIRTQNSGDHMNVTLENVNIVSTKGECAINSEITSGKESLVVKSGKINGDIYLNLRSGIYVVASVCDGATYMGETKVITSNPAYKLKTTSGNGKTTYGIEIELDCDLYLSDPYLQTSGEYSVCSVSGGNLSLNMSAGSSNNPAFKNIKVYRDFTANSYFSITAGEYSVPCITTLDLNGKTVTANNGLTFASNTSTKYAPPTTSDYRNRITICDTVGGGKIIAKNSKIYVNSVELIINGGVFDIAQFLLGTANGSNRAKGVVTINGGTFTVPTTYVDTLKTYVTSGSTVTINGQSYTAE